MLACYEVKAPGRRSHGPHRKRVCTAKASMGHASESPMRPAATTVETAQPQALYWMERNQGNARDAGSLVISFGLLVGLSFFALSETAITTLWPWKVKELAEQEGEGSPFKMLQKDITRFLTTILVGSTFVTTAATALINDVAKRSLGDASLGPVTAVLTVFMTLFCEILPKSVAVQFATEGKGGGRRSLALVLYPVGRLCTIVSNALLGAMGLKSTNEPFVSEQELKLVLGGAAKSGALEVEERSMIEDVLELKATELRWVMTPLVDVVAVEAKASLEEFRQLWLDKQFTRVPVYEGRIDNIVGIAYSMDLLTTPGLSDRQTKTVTSLLSNRAPYFVPESMSTWNLLKEIRRRNNHMAIVVNEYGGVSGIVTLEDAIEEVVGEIYDETDAVEHSLISQRTDDAWDCDCRATMEELREVTGFDFPEGPYDTVSGFTTSVFERIPGVGEQTEVSVPERQPEEELQGVAESETLPEVREYRLRLSVLSASDRRIRTVRIERVHDRDDATEREKALQRQLPEESDAFPGGTQERSTDKGELD